METIDTMLGSDTVNTTLVEVILASQLHFFFAADPAWCRARILPLLDWSAPARARRTWQGFLAWGRVNNQLLATGLLDQYLKAVEHRNEFSTEHQHQLTDHLAGIALFSDVDPVAADGWLNRFTATDDPTMRTTWINQVGWHLGRLTTEDVEQQWQRWMRQYWTDRVAGRPRQLTVEEASAMARWALNLGDSITEGVDLITSSPAGLDEHAGLLHDLDDDQIDRAPAEVARLLLHLLNHTERFHADYSLRTLVLRLRTHGVETDDIIQAALRLGVGDAPTW